MNFANALGFVGVGAVMWLLPILAPGWFQHVAMDGSSTRALWVQLMGLVQCGLGGLVIARHGAEQFARTMRALRRGAVATAEWEPDAVPAPLIVVDLAGAGALTEISAAAARSEGHAPTPWRALARTLQREPRVAARLRTLVRRHGAHPVASALFRHHPKLSFVHLTQSKVADYRRSEVGALASDALEHVRHMLEQLADKPDEDPLQLPAQ